MYLEDSDDDNPAFVKADVFMGARCNEKFKTQNYLIQRS
jgi:hypothetical protein